jgi:hypothetical protein
LFSGKLTAVRKYLRENEAMLYRTQFKSILIFLNLLFIDAAQGQWLPQETNYYNPKDETLNLPCFSIIHSDSNPIQLPSVYST